MTTMAKAWCILLLFNPICFLTFTPALCLLLVSLVICGTLTGIFCYLVSIWCRLMPMYNRLLRRRVVAYIFLEPETSPGYAIICRMAAWYPICYLERESSHTLSWSDS